MFNEEQARQWVDAKVEAQTAGIQMSKSAKRGRSKRHADERRDRPLNVLGCFALIHAIRSIDSAARSKIVNRPATVA
jgi:hypothetical protein